MSQEKINIYKGKPWKSLDEYFELSLKYGLYGEDLAVAVKRDNRVKIPLPVLKVPKNAITHKNEPL